ncbi:MAG: NTP transferase domain-containing protein [Flavobacteriales bacterium]|nr:NTP transferase domain-containing protein [Flavobacteriales bacterium]
MEHSELIILAAGESSRMQRPKALLPFLDKGISFVECIVNTYLSAGIKKITIVTSEKLNYELNLLFPFGDIKIITNTKPQLERMYSVYLGIKEVSNDHYVYIQDCDNPFVPVEIIRELYKHKNEADYIVPMFNAKGGHPILLSPKIIKYIKALNQVVTEDTLKNHLRLFIRKNIPVNTNSIHANINTPELFQQNNLAHT